MFTQKLEGWEAYGKAERHLSKMILNKLFLNLAAIRITWLHLRPIKSE